MKKQVSYKIVSLIFGVLVICFAVAFYALGVWTEPTAIPPEDNVPAPLNTSSQAQIKIGGLILNTGGYPNGLIVDQGNVGIGTTSPQAKLDVNGTVRMTSFQLGTSATNGYVLTTNASGVGTWQAALGGGGGITSLSQGNGITLSPNPVTATGTISANTSYLQRRVNSCGANQAIRVINADGTVSCVNLPPSAICTYNGRTYSSGAQCYTGSCSGTYTAWQCQSDGSWYSLGTSVYCSGLPSC